MEEPSPSKLFQKIEHVQDAILPGTKDQREGKIIPKTWKHTFAPFLNIIVGKLKLNIFLFKKSKVLLLTLVILSIISTLYLLFSKGATERNVLYALVPIVLLIVFYMVLRYWAQYRSQVEVINPTYANISNSFKEYRPNSATTILAKIFNLRFQNILTRITWVVFLFLALYLAYRVFQDLGNNF